MSVLLSENHFAGIRRSEGVAAEMRARARATGVVDPEPIVAGLDPLPATSEMERWFAFFGLLADPAAAKKRMTEYVATCDKARTDSESAVLENRRKIAEETTHHEEKVARLAADREAFEAERRAARAEIQQRDQHSRTMNNQAAADAAAVAQLRSTLEAKLKLIRQAETL
jgi:hypothetical protein